MIESHVQRIIERWDRDRRTLWLTPTDIDTLIDQIRTLAEAAAENEAIGNKWWMELQRVKKLQGQDFRHAIGGMKL